MSVVCLLLICTLFCESEERLVQRVWPDGLPGISEEFKSLDLILYSSTADC